MCANNTLSRAAGRAIRLVDMQVSKQCFVCASLCAFCLFKYSKNRLSPAVLHSSSKKNYKVTKYTLMQRMGAYLKMVQSSGSISAVEQTFFLSL